MRLFDDSLSLGAGQMTKQSANADHIQAVFFRAISNYITNLPHVYQPSVPETAQSTLSLLLKSDSNPRKSTTPN
jgi:hypothetical protein